MTRRTLGVIATGALVLGLAGMALAASTTESSATSTSLDTTSSTVDDDSASTSSTSAPSTTLDNDRATSTTVNDDRSSATSDDDHTTSTTLDGDTTTSTTSPGDTTSTSFDDNGGDRDEAVADMAPQTFEINGVGTVTVQVVDGRLDLVGFDAPGWDAEIKKADADDVRLRFRRDSHEAEIEIELHHGALEIAIETKS